MMSTQICALLFTSLYLLCHVVIARFKKHADFTTGSGGLGWSPLCLNSQGRFTALCSGCPSREPPSACLPLLVAIPLPWHWLLWEISPGYHGSLPPPPPTSPQHWETSMFPGLVTSASLPGTAGAWEQAGKGPG